MTVAVLALTLLLAAANGGNDNGKAVATLGGAGVAGYRRAIAWGTAATFVGALASLQLAERLTKLFSSGIVTSAPTPAFALAVLIGASAWVAGAIIARLPVSTTHAIVGALVGAGLAIGADAVAWSALASRVAGPLLISVVVAYVASAALNALPARVLPDCICVTLQEREPVVFVGNAATAVPPGSPRLPAATFETGTTGECRLHGGVGGRMALTIDRLHWLSAGAASFARGLNDTPKIAAIGAFALVPAGMRAPHVSAAVAVAMAIGGLVAALRIAPRLGNDIVAMDHRQGARANMATALLVGVGALRGLPLSATHVSAGAIAGASGTQPHRLHSSTIGQFLVAWSVTPAVSAAIAAAAHLLLR